MTGPERVINHGGIRVEGREQSMMKVEIIMMSLNPVESFYNEFLRTAADKSLDSCGSSTLI